jgi:hypothetical protein
VDTAGCILQGDVRTKVKTPDTGKIMVEEAVQTSIFPVQDHAWPPTSRYSKIFSRFKNNPLKLDAHSSSPTEAALPPSLAESCGQKIHLPYPVGQ